MKVDCGINFTEISINVTYFIIYPDFFKAYN